MTTQQFWIDGEEHARDLCKSGYQKSTGMITQRIICYARLISTSVRQISLVTCKET